MSFEAIVSITASPDMIGRSRSSSTMTMDCSASMRTASSPLYATRVAYPFEPQRVVQRGGEVTVIFDDQYAHGNLLGYVGCVRTIRFHYCLRFSELSEHRRLVMEHSNVIKRIR